MKYLRLVLVVLTAGVLMLLGSSSASATELTCGSSMCGPETAISASSELKITIDAPFGNIECGSILEGKTSTTGDASSTASVSLSSVSFTNCGGDTFKVLAPGVLEVHTKESTADNNGTVTWTGLKLTTIHLGVHCIFETSSTDIGTLTGSASRGGGKATLDFSGTIPRVGGEGGAFCGSSAPWTGSFSFESPSILNVD